MSNDKAIESGKEHRRPYRGSKAIDYTCRNHGSCVWCEGNRLLNRRKRAEAAKSMERINYDGEKID